MRTRKTYARRHPFVDEHFVAIHRAYFIAVVMLAFAIGACREPPTLADYIPDPAPANVATLSIEPYETGIAIDLASTGGETLARTQVLVAGSNLAIDGEGAEAIAALCPPNDRGRLECSFGEIDRARFGVSGDVSFVRADFYVGGVPYYLEALPP